MKLVLLEVSHWHFPLYIDALLNSEAEVIAVSDRNPEVREQYGNLFSCLSHANWLQALDGVTPDAAVAFGRHVEMPKIGRTLIERGIPFAIEKPAGLTVDDIVDLRKRAEEARVPVAVPLVQRIGPLQALLDRLVKEEEAVFTMTAWRFNAGPPARYPAMKCDWMLDSEMSGGGCLMNLGAHLIDLALGLMPNPPDSVFAHLDDALHGAGVEDTALVTMTARAGGRALVETGYNFPDSAAKREYSFSLASREHYLQTLPGGVIVHRPGGKTEMIEMNLDSDPMYGAFVSSWLSDLQTGAQTVPGLTDLEPAMRVIDAAHAAARVGCSVAFGGGPAALL
ncbi:MAG: oxidoreductase [Rhodospirillaceae bacterium]|nr:oxidoreductase [Rhodospirillaceae bacterium]